MSPPGLDAWVFVVGGGRTGIVLASVTPSNDAHDSKPQPLFDYVVRQLATLNLAYIHIIEGATGGERELPDRPFDYVAPKAAYRQAGGKGASRRFDIGSAGPRQPDSTVKVIFAAS